MIGQEELGKIEVNNDVIAKISLLAAKEVAGIVTDAGSARDIREILHGKSKGVSVSTDETKNFAIIDLDVNVEYGVDIYKASHQLQRKVKDAVETMTGKPVKAVNVRIKSIVEGSGQRSNVQAFLPRAEESKGG